MGSIWPLMSKILS